MKTPYLLPLSLLILFAVAWAGCATGTPPLVARHDASRDALYQRAVELWTAIVEKDNLKIVEFLSPETKQIFSRFQSLGSNTFNTLDFHIDAVQVDETGTRGIVIVTNTFLASPIPNPRTIPGQVTSWTLVDGVWYHEYESAQPIISGNRLERERMMRQRENEEDAARSNESSS